MLIPSQRLIHATTSMRDGKMVHTPYGAKMPAATSHWTMERALSIGLAGIIPAAYFVHGPVMDYLLTTSILLHAHWGMMEVGTDYGKFLPGPLVKAVHPTLYAISILSFASLCYFNFNDVGVTAAISAFWKL